MAGAVARMLGRPVVAVNNIVNPGAESGMSGWTQDSGGPATAINTTGSGWPGPHSGSYYFHSAASAVSSAFSQIFEVPSSYHSNIDAGLLAVELTAYQAGSSNTDDYGTLVLECLDSSNSILASFSAQQFKTKGAAGWVYRAAKIGMPAGTRKLRIGTSNTRAEGTSLDSYWDDFAYILTTSLTLWSNSGGSGNRTASITVSATNITTMGGALSDLVDGAQSDEYWWNNATGNGTAWLKFDFGSAKVVDAFRWYQSNSSTHGTWRLEGSNDDSSWTQIGSDFTLGGETAASPILNGGGIFYFSNTTAYRYYRLRHMAGSRVTSPYLREIDFRIA